MIKYFSYVLWKRANDGKSKTLYRYILMTALIAAFAVSGIAMDTQAQSGLTYTFVDNTKDLPPSADTVTVIGHPLAYVIQNGDTLLDIARNYSLGYNELEDLYPELNPWVPTVGKELVLPRIWVLPQVRKTGIVINLAEFRLYHFLEKKGVFSDALNYFEKTNPNDESTVRFVRTYPVGIGDETWNSPVGSFRIIDKRVKPTWYIPPSLISKYHPVKIVPPGPNNPLGDYFMGIGNAYGIHGTDNPWSVGRLVTHGCIRLYPEDIEFLFPTVALGTPVEIVYEPVKIGFLNGKIYAEVHRDIYGKISDFYQYGYQKLADLGLMESVDPVRFEEELERKSGMPVEVGTLNISRNL